MKRTQVNAIVDTLAYVGFVFLATTGFLLRYQLPPGSGAAAPPANARAAVPPDNARAAVPPNNASYRSEDSGPLPVVAGTSTDVQDAHRLHGVGTGRGGRSKSIYLLWGFSRHEWGSLHYWIALGLLAILTIHVVLHWSWIRCALQGYPRGQASGQRFLLGLTGLVCVVLLASAPLLSPVQRVPRSLGQDDIHQDAAKEAMAHGEIRGFMTLSEVARASGVPVPYLINKLQLPPDVSLDARVGRMLGSHGLQMQDLRRVISEYAPPESE